MYQIKKYFIIGILSIGVLLSLLSCNFLTDIKLYKVKNEAGQSQKFYVVNQSKAQDILKNYDLTDENDNENEEFDIINFIEKLNGDFSLDY